MKKFNTNRRYISMNKTFVFMATILLLASFIPVGNSIAKKKMKKTIEVPVQIYTLGNKRNKKRIASK